MSNISDPIRPSYDKLLSDFLVRIRRLEAVPIRGHYQIKVFADANAGDGELPVAVRIVTAGDAKFQFGIPEDLNGSFLIRCMAYVTTVGSGLISVQIRNVTQAVDMLTDPIEIEAGDFNSYQATNPPVPDTSVLVETGDQIAIDVDSAGGGVAQGLGVGLELAHPAST